jgi:glycosyltransferase involved in cell wall biosynthesis
MNQSLKVLMVNRSDAYEVSGGDVIQMEKTAAALAKFGVQLTTRLVNQLNNESNNYDFIHVFNIQTAEESRQAVQWARTCGVPVALSPIYWDSIPAWFGNDDILRPVWRIIKRVIGYRLGLWFFTGWQRRRRIAQAHWQIQRDLLLSADQILPNSHAEARVLARDFRLSEKWNQEALIVPNAVNGRMFSELVKPSKAFLDSVGGVGYALQVGRVSPEKNNLGLIEALWDIDISIVFVGQPSPYDSDYVKRCRERAFERGRVHFVRWIPHDELPAVYRFASVHVLPSWRETPGLVSLEAAAAGCRVVSTSVGSAHEYFGEFAWYCHPANERSIRQAVLAALETPKSKLLQQHVLRNFTWDKVARATLNGYQRVMKRKKSASRLSRVSDY